MKNLISPVFTIMLVLSMSLLCGCDEDSANESAIGPDVSGDWSGEFYVGGSARTPISASISQNGRAVFLETSLPQAGHFFTGEMNGAGGMFMTDAWDGETWTTPLGPATPSHIMLADYSAGGGSALRVIDLRK